MKENKIIYHFKNSKWFRFLDKEEPVPGGVKKIILFNFDNRFDIVSIIRRGMKEFYFSLEDRFNSRDLIIKELLSLGGKLKHSERKDIKGKSFLLFFLDKSAILYYSTKKSEEVKREKYLILSLYPFISKISYRSTHILRILSRLDKEYGFQVFARNYVVKRYYVNPETRVCYKETSYEYVFGRALEDGVWVDSILVGLYKNQKFCGTLRISRKGIISFKYLDFSEIFNNVTSHIINVYKYVEKIISSVKSRSLENLDVELISFKLKENVFSQPSFTERFVDLIKRKLIGWGFSVISYVGPFIQIMLHDYVSGSSYDILISSSDSLTIIPQTQVTKTSLWYLLNFLQYNYDGEIEIVR